MSAKQAATYHGADIVTRLRVQAPYSDDGQAMTEAAKTIESLRLEVVHAWDRGHTAGVWNATADSDEPFRDNPYARTSDE